MGVSIDISIYIYIYRERERETDIIVAIFQNLHVESKNHEHGFAIDCFVLMHRALSFQEHCVCYSREEIPNTRKHELICKNTTIKTRKMHMGFAKIINKRGRAASRTSGNMN